MTKATGVDLCMLLWQSNHRAIVEEFIDLGFMTRDDGERITQDKRF